MVNCLFKSKIELFPEPVIATIELVEEDYVRAEAFGTTWFAKPYNPSSPLSLKKGQHVQVIGRESLTLLIAG